MKLLVVLVCLGCVWGTQSVWSRRREASPMGHEGVPSHSKLGLDSRRTTSGPVISSEYKASGTSKTQSKKVSHATTAFPAMFYSSETYSSQKNIIRTYLPYYPDDADSMENTAKEKFDYPVPPGYENASWTPVTDTFILNSVKEYVLINGVCRTLPFVYYDPLSISPYTTYSYSTTVRGVESDVFTYNSSDYNVTLYVEQANNSIPLGLVGETEALIFTYAYHTFVAGVDFQPSFFEIPDTCEPPGLICEGDGVHDIEILRFHAPDDFDIADQNGADLLGVVSFICVAVLEHSEPGYAWISKFNVSIDTAFGNYGLCNLHNCWTLNQNAVGRETSYGIGEGGGQCTPDSALFGEWYSFTSASECHTGPVSPDNHCSWEVNYRISTIDIDCLDSLGFLDDCRADKGFPFPTATATMQQGFAVCPDPSSN